MGLLEPISSALNLLNTHVVAPQWFPYALAPTLHAARVSSIYQANARLSSRPLSWGQYLTGYLLMCWGGGIGAHLLLGLPPPMFYSFHPTINYLSVHFLATTLFHIFPNLLYPPVLDTIFWPLDALLRVNAICTVLGFLENPRVYPEYRNSSMAHLIVGAIVSAGGGVTVTTIGGWTSDWTFSTPPFLRAGAGWTGTLDIWGGALVALIYGTVTGHPAFSPLHPYVATLGPSKSATHPFLNSLDGRSLGAVFLGALFASRVMQTHWLTLSRPAPVAFSPKKKEKKKAH